MFPDFLDCLARNEQQPSAPRRALHAAKLEPHLAMADAVTHDH
ncbi:MAG TPA: hypothetical protein VGN04_09485 [Herbaspirillum sp.]|jgi:hypothetical protein